RARGPVPPGSTPCLAPGASRGRASWPPGGGARRGGRCDLVRTGRTRSRREDGCYTRCMPRVAPFVALTFDPAVSGPLGRVTAPPYDVIGAEARRQYLAMSPFNIVHLELGEEQGPDDVRYEAAGALLSKWRAEGVRVAAPRAGY